MIQGHSHVPGASSQLSQQFYDQLGDDWLESCTTPDWDQRILDLLVAWLPPKGRVLDVGCGYGRTAIPLALCGYEVTGVDISARMVAAAERRAAQAQVDVRFLRADMCDLELDEGYFDSAICLWSAFHELLIPEEQLRSISAINRVLRSGGRALIEGPPFLEPTTEEKLTGQRYGNEFRLLALVIQGHPNHRFCHDQQSLGSLLSRSGINRFSVTVQDWAGRPRQITCFEKT